jgi:hypothetical protein
VWGAVAPPSAFPPPPAPLSLPFSPTRPKPHTQDCVVGDSPSSGAGAGSSSSAGAGADKSVTFLFKYAVGPCPKSYGLNVARLARLPESVIMRAAAKSEEFEVAVAEAEQEAASAAAAGGSSSSSSAAARLLLGADVSTPSHAASSAAVRPLGASPDSLPATSRGQQLSELYKTAAAAMDMDVEGGAGSGLDVDAVYALACSIRGAGRA